MLKYFLYCKIAPIITAYADVEAANGENSSIIKWIERIIGILVAGVCGFIAIVMLISLAKDAWGMVKGNGNVSAVKIVKNVLIFGVMMGLAYLALSYMTFGETFSKLGDKATTAASDIIDEFGGDSTK